MSFVLMIWGAPASGKTTIAHQLRRRLEACCEVVVHLSPDSLNEALVGPRFVGALRPAIYEGLMAMSRRMLMPGHGLILDGTFLRREARQRVAEMAGDSLFSVLVHCSFPSRMGRNGARPDDSRVPMAWLRKAHYQAMVARNEAGLVVDTDRLSLDECVERVLAGLERRGHTPASHRATFEDVARRAACVADSTYATL